MERRNCRKGSAILVAGQQGGRVDFYLDYLK